ncbi:conserved membrane hypothetical protein [Hyella patelloides LEGE 07179]|uniref:Carbohydrate-binding/sugar hydrolysis domain-containing protein n=1 Tax=Hyella patelloides LEGE 07179 TaxID=945734 RepID=A0A563VJ82_9CYAN|nr:right-handed parallel beta-helix repeat-containing protein [Hyella patelloides]VEP11516.1 conserved membrane hypothetical protein [Hyella patelloides LEGE 07179]
MISRNSFPGKTVVVAKSDTADYKTIGEAIDNAEPETRILVKPGIYRESLVINKTLEILGDGQVSNIVIESTDASCILMHTEQAIVRGLTLRGCNGKKGHKCFAVQIYQGKLILEDCDITSDSYGCVLIHGHTANPLILRCQIHDGKSNGIRIKENGLGTIEDCDIFGNAHPGVYIATGSNPNIRHCRIYDGKSNGISIEANSQGTIEDCEIYGNINPGVSINTSSNPVIRRCQIYDGKGCGIRITENSQGKIEDCNIYNNGNYPELTIETSSNPVIRNCCIHDGKSNGIGITEKGLGTIEDCDIYGNAYPGVYIDTGSNPTIRQCRIYDGKQSGISIKEKGLGTIEDCDIYGNTYPGVSINGSNPTIRQCRIYDGKSYGIWIKESGLGIIEDCDIYGNTRVGVSIDTYSNPTIRQCRIYDGKQSGISIKEQGLGTIEDCDIYRNTNAGVLINNSNPTIRRCHIYDGKQEGISIQTLGQGSIQYCRIERHPSPGIKIEKRCHPVFRRCTLKTNQPSYLELAVILGLSMALPIAVAGGWAIPPTIAVVLAAIAIVAYRLRKKGFSQKFILLVIYLTMILGLNSGIAFVFGFNLYVLLALLIAGGILAIMIFYPAFEQAKLMSKYNLTKPTRNKFIE